MLLLAAIAFLTRVPVPARWQFGASDVGRSTVFFPLVGAGLGVVSLGVLYLFKFLASFKMNAGLPSFVVAAFVIAVSAWMTGALHLDGLADMVDGFGGGRTREDVLRIMRDHVIGAYGAVALILVVLIKVTTIAALIERDAAQSFLIIGPALGRWASVPLGCFMPYARREGGGLGAAVTDYVGWKELVGASLIVALLTLGLAGWRGAVCWLAVVIVTAFNARMCMRRIGGVTGDTLGSNTEICEAVVLTVAVLLTH